MTYRERWQGKEEVLRLMSFGVDFLTATFKENWKLDLWIDWLYRRGGGEQRDSRIRQFRGFWLNDWFAGAERQEGEFKLGLAQAVGSAADEAIGPLKEIQPDGISRIDLQVTITGHEVDIDCIYERLLMRGKNATLITGTKGGRTLYIGSRASARFVRIYRKLPDRDGYAGWRFEVEFKRPLAKETWLRILTHNMVGVVLLAELARIDDPDLLPFVGALRGFACTGELANIKFPSKDEATASHFWDKVAKPWMVKVLSANRDVAEVKRMVSEAIYLIQNTGHRDQLCMWAERELFGDMEQEKWTEEPPWED